MHSRISGYLTTYNCHLDGRPFDLAIRSLLPFCQEVVVVDGGSDDGTWEILGGMARTNPKIKVFRSSIMAGPYVTADFLSTALKQEARSKCSGDYCFELNSDEVVDPSSYDKIMVMPELLKNSQPGVLMLPTVEFWGSFDSIRADKMAWQARFSRNQSEITHVVTPETSSLKVTVHSLDKVGITGELEPIVPLGLGVEAFKKLTFAQRESWFMERLEVLPFVLKVIWLSSDNRSRFLAKDEQNQISARLFSYSRPIPAELLRWGDAVDSI